MESSFFDSRILSRKLSAHSLHFARVVLDTGRIDWLRHMQLMLHKLERVFKGPLRPSFRDVCLGLVGTGSQKDYSTMSTVLDVSLLDTCAF